MARKTAATTQVPCPYCAGVVRSNALKCQHCKKTLAKSTKGSNDRGIYEHPVGSDVWWIVYYHNGQRHREKIGSKTAARDIYAQRKTEIRLRKFDPEQVTKRIAWTVGEMMKHYRKQRTSDGPRNQAEDARYASYWEAEFGKMKLEELQPKHLAEWRAKRLKNVKPATVNRALTYLKAYYNLAVRDKRCVSNPVEGLKALRENNARTRYLLDEEEPKLRQEFTEEHWDIVAFAVNTGLRQGEQFALAWRQVNPQAEVIEIPEPKGGEKRHVPINDEVAAILRRQRERFPDSKWVFPAPGDPAVHRVGRNFAVRQFDRLCERAKIADLVWHDLRHTFGSRLAMAGVPLRTIQVLMGHKSIRMTERYAHLSPSNLQQAVKLLGTRTATRQPAPESQPPEQPPERKALVNA